MARVPGLYRCGFLTGWYVPTMGSPAVFALKKHQMSSKTRILAREDRLTSNSELPRFLGLSARGFTRRLLSWRLVAFRRLHRPSHAAESKMCGACK